MSCEKLDQGGSDGLGGILLHEVTGVRDDVKLRMRNRPMESLPNRDRDPLVLLAPYDEDRAPDLTVTVLDLIRIPLIHLRDLAVEGGLPL